MNTRRVQQGQTEGATRKTDAPNNSSIVSYTSYDSFANKITESVLHGGFLSVATAQALDAVPTDLNVSVGISKIMVVVLAGTDLAGSITVTGTTVDRDTGVETSSDTEAITVDALTVDASSTDSNGNILHAFSGAYMTTKWFKGSVVLSTTDLTLTDVDVYSVSFDQLNDSPDYIIDTLDITLFANSTLAVFDAYIIAVILESDGKTTITRLADGDINLGTPVADKFYRMRRANLGQAMNGATDGFFCCVYIGSANRIEDLNLRVWCTVNHSGTRLTALALRGAATPATVTDHAVVRWDGTDGKTIQNSNTTISDAGVMTVDDGSGNAIVLTPGSAVSIVTMNGTVILAVAPGASKTTAISAPAGTGSTIEIKPNDTGGVATIELKNNTSGKTTTVNVGSDASGGTGSINADNLTAMRTDGDLTLAANGSGDVIVDGVKVSDIIQRQASFSFVDPITGQDFLLDGIPVGATITECYAIVNGGASAVFSIVMRVKSAPFSAGTTIVDAQTAELTGATKTIASPTYTADTVLRITTGTVTGGVTELLVLLVYTVN